jgi:hypothetical protein
MTEVQMQLRRALWTKLVKDATRDSGYQWTITIEAHDTVLKYWHPDSPGWSFTVEIARGKTNVILILEDKETAFKTGRATLVDRMNASRAAYDASKQSATHAEAEAKSWVERQEKELAGLKEIPWLALTIITEGPYAGSYRVGLEPGNPLERLTIVQVKEFHALCHRLNWKT